MEDNNKVVLRTNYFKFNCGTPILKYKVDTNPTIPSTQVGLLFKLLSKLRTSLFEKLGTYQPSNFMIYSPTQTDEAVFHVEYENTNYEVKILPCGILDINSGEKEALVFMGRFFKVLQSQLRLKQIGRKFFNDNAPENFEKWKLTVWPGYQTSLNQYRSNILVNVDTCFKVVRETTVLEFIEDLMGRFHGSQERVIEEMTGMVIMTKYNNTLYSIHSVDFNLNAKSTFEMKDGSSISFMEYYEKKYNKKLSNPQQPLIIHKRKKDGGLIQLIPELCVLTGQSDDMRQNFQLQKDLNQIIKPRPQQRLEEAQRLLQILAENDRTKDMLKKWDISTSLDPLKVEGQRIEAGNIILGRQQTFSLEQTPDFDRKVQTEMLEQQEIKRIGVFYSSRDKETFRTFMDTLQKCVETFNYPMGQPKEFAIEGKSFSDWERVMKANLNPSVQAVILLLPGRKKNGMHYDEIKRFLLTQCPVPSQVVLVSTIQAGKNLRSIINKVLIQICAKVGGTPWSVSEFPLTEKPTCVVGIDVFHRTSMKSDSLLAYCATMNRHLSRYWSTIDQHGPGEELGKGIQTAVKNSLLAFKETNGIFPQRLIVFRDGVSDSQRKTLMEIEVKGFLRAFDELRSEGLDQKPEFIFICANKRINSKFFQGDSCQRDGLRNPEQGTVVSDEITTNQDFYLISQKTNQGSASPTHYYILSYYHYQHGDYIDSAEDLPEDLKHKIQVLTYKMCYMYYNWSGSIRVPAPIQYAHKLSNLIGDRWKPNVNMIPHKVYEKYKSLYFICGRDDLMVCFDEKIKIKEQTATTLY